jgi:ABC-2 type transport system permease protein
MSASPATALRPAREEPHRFRRPSTLTVTRWELRKLLSQKRTFLGLGIAIVFPVIFVVAVGLHHHHPHEGGNVFFSEVTQSGLATPVLTLFLESALLLPVAASLVAGDVIAAEDGNGTLKTILTRSVDRGQVFAAKAITAGIYAVIATCLSALVATVLGIASWGFNDVVTFSGTVVSAPRGLLLVAAAYGVYLIPLLAVSSIGVLLSTVTRNSAASVVGTLGLTLLLALISQIPGLEGSQPYLLPTEFSSWHGLLRTPTDWAPIAHSAWVCALYAIPSLIAAYLVFLRRDVTGG